MEGRPTNEKQCMVRRELVVCCRLECVVGFRGSEKFKGMEYVQD